VRNYWRFDRGLKTPSHSAGWDADKGSTTSYALLLPMATPAPFPSSRHLAAFAGRSLPSFSRKALSSSSVIPSRHLPLVPLLKKRPPSCQTSRSVPGAKSAACCFMFATLADLTSTQEAASLALVQSDFTAAKSRLEALKTKVTDLAKGPPAKISPSDAKTLLQDVGVALGCVQSLIDG
jgi:hypothetical protein